MRHIHLFATLALLLPLAEARAQFPFQPWADWRTIETAHFQVHAPRELEPWARHAAARLEAVRGEVLGAVGHVPEGKVQVVVHDPYGQANGSAWPMLDFPMMVLWPVAPSPRSAIGNYGDWSALLTIHEFTHLAHLTVPSRNPALRLLWSLAPRPVGPVAQKSPRWVIEGYATYVEGRLTGLGRPYGAYRAAILRQWAIEGALPTYPQLSASGAYLGGSLAYLGGSAYLEWLARRGGDSSLVHLWRRMSARVDRGFPQAFAGVYGRTPEALYGRFTAELTRDALAVEGAIDSLGGRREGELVQRLAWGTGDPAVSPDGKLVALSLASGSGPRRLVVIPAAAAPDTMRATRRAKLLARDPLDVPDSQFFPPPRTPRATLRARQGLSFEEPRWMPGGARILVSRATPRADGTQRQDLYLWEWKSGRVQRVTHGAGVQQADPSPDGRRAVATRCTRGSCDIVLVDLASGAVRTLLAGGFDRVYQHPRFAPDGARIALTMLREGRWRVALTDTAGAPPRTVDADDGAHRYDPVFADSGRALLATSERGGIANIERIPLDGSAPATLTRVTGAAVAPVQDPAGRSVWFLALHARGLDLRRLPSDTGASRALPVLPATLAPAVPARAPFRAAPLAVAQAGPSRGYGAGPRQWSWIPLGNAGADGGAGAVNITTADPIGRLTGTITAAHGSPGSWRGGRVAARWNRWAQGELFGAEQRADSARARMVGGLLRVSAEDRRNPRLSASSGLALMRVRDSAAAPRDVAPAGAFTRFVATTEVAISHTLTRGGWGVMEGFSAQVATGRTRGAQPGGTDWFGRTITRVDLGVRTPFTPTITGMVQTGRLDHDAPFERFRIGGLRPLVVNEQLLGQRIFFPALPTSAASGARFAQARVGMQLGMVQPFYWTASIGEPGARLSRWTRAFGVDARLRAPALTLVATPELALDVGVVRTVDDRKTRVYVGTAVTP
jgi:hypothetical protein